MGNYCRTLAGITGLLALLHAAPASDPTQVWSEAWAKVMASANHAASYACVQTVERRYFAAYSAGDRHGCPLVVGEVRDPEKVPHLWLAFTDRLRLDVTMARRGEIFSWAGASHFEDEDIDRVVRYGPIGTGSFGSFLSMIFGRDVGEFWFAGRKLVEGVDAMEYAFRVPQKDSHYYVRVRGAWVTAGYFGSVFVNSATCDVMRLAIETLDPDFTSGSCQTSTILDFGNVQIGATPLLLPVYARQMFLRADGARTENTTTFTKCREFLGESSIVFGAPAAPSLEPVSHRGIETIATGQPFQLSLLDAIDSATVAAGDSFRAKMIGTLYYDTIQRKIAPSGSVVEGRVLRVQINHFPARVDLVLAPEAVVVQDERVALAANREWKGQKKGAYILVPLSREQPAGVFRLVGRDVVFPRGTRSDWRTVSVKAQ